MDGGEPDIPVYKVIECIGPTNTRVYTVAVYFRGKRLATANGHSIQQAEMKSAEVALENSRALFPQLDYQKRVITQSIKRQKGKEYVSTDAEALTHERWRIMDDQANLPKQYRLRDSSTSDAHSDVTEERTSETKKKPKRKTKKRCSGSRQPEAPKQPDAPKQADETRTEIADLTDVAPATVAASIVENKSRDDNISALVDGTEDIESEVSVSSMESGEIE